MIATAEVTDRAGFLTALRRAELLPDAQFVRAVAKIPAAASARQAAAQLVRDGLLTRYQADRVLAGKTDGFHLGQYLILEPLGRGKVGKAYKARHAAMDRLVAVEVLPPALVRAAADRAEVHREARAAAQLAHPHLVTLLDANDYGERLYFVLEYVDGASLDEVVRSQGALPVAEACEYARQAALGLAHAHEKGMAHGGFSPASLLVGRPGGVGPAAKPTVKVLNVGLSRLALFAAGTGDLHAAADAAEYLAPEQLSEPGRADPGCDLYALGCTLHFLLTGHPPRPAGSGGPLLHQFAEAVPVEVVRPEVPPPVAALIGGLMAKDPAGRPRSAAEVAAWLAPFAAGNGSAGHIDFALPRAVPLPDSNGYLSGLAPTPPAEPSPFADLDDDGTGPQAFDVSDAPSVPRRASAGSGAMAGVLVLAAGIIAAVVLTVGMVLRSVTK